MERYGRRQGSRADVTSAIGGLGRLSLPSLAGVRLPDRHDRAHGVANEPASLLATLPLQFELVKRPDQARTKAQNDADKTERLRDVSHPRLARSREGEC